MGKGRELGRGSLTRRGFCGRLLTRTLPSRSQVATRLPSGDTHRAVMMLQKWPSRNARLPASSFPTPPPAAMPAAQCCHAGWLICAGKQRSELCSTPRQRTDALLYALPLHTMFTFVHDRPLLARELCESQPRALEGDTCLATILPPGFCDAPACHRRRTSDLSHILKLVPALGIQLFRQMQKRSIKLQPSGAWGSRRDISQQEDKKKKIKK